MQQFDQVVAPPATKPPVQRGRLAYQTEGGMVSVGRTDGDIKPPNAPFDWKLLSPEGSSKFPRCPSSCASKQRVFVLAALMSIILLAQGTSFSQQLSEYSQNGRLELCAVAKNFMSAPVWPSLSFRNSSPRLLGSSLRVWAAPTPIDAFFYTNPLVMRSLNSPAYAVEGIEVVRYRGIIANDGIVFFERQILRTTAIAPLQSSGSWSSRTSFKPQTGLTRTVEIHIREVVTLPSNPSHHGPINIAF
jgi:hypothetical protein